MINIGDPGPQFTGTDILTGQTHHLSDYAGEVVMLIFSGPSWCPPCQFEAPVLEQIWQTFKKSYTVPKVQLLMIPFLEDDGKLKQTVEFFGLTFPVLINLDVDAVDLYITTDNTTAVPTIVVLDTEQKVCAIQVGASGTEEELYQELYGLLIGCGAAEAGTFPDPGRWRAIVTILFGVIQDGGGLVLTPGGKPIPIDPLGPLMRMNAAQQDLYTSLAIAQLAGGLHDVGAANQIRSGALGAAEVALRAIVARAAAAPVPEKSFEAVRGKTR